MCQFYRDPENAGMAQRQRAERSFSLLKNLDDRITHYNNVEQEFHAAVEQEFGGRLWLNIVKLKQSAQSKQSLPTVFIDAKARFNFVDASCRPSQR